MRVALHILTQPGDTLAHEVIEKLRQQSEQEIKVFELTAENPDYAGLVQEIFAADSVAVW